MNILEKIDQVFDRHEAIAQKSPTENAALVICELAAPRVKSAMGGRFAEGKNFMPI